MRSLLPLGAGLLAFALALPAGAQTTHTVTLAGFSFTPKDLTIDVGDTVKWVWSSGLHTVTSGLNGVPDGAFRSGNPVSAPHEFSLTFDQAFLAGSPHTCNRFDYYCEVHVTFGMVGSITVNVPAASAARNGSGINPTGYVELSPAVVGGTWSTMVDIATPGAIASVVAVATKPFQFPTSFGELLIDPSALAAPFDVAGSVHNVAIPNDCSLMGLSLATQAATFKPGQIRLQNAIDIVLGS